MDTEKLVDNTEDPDPLIQAADILEEEANQLALERPDGASHRLGIAVAREIRRLRDIAKALRERRKRDLEIAVAGWPLAPDNAPLRFRVDRSGDKPKDEAPESDLGPVGYGG